MSDSEPDWGKRPRISQKDEIEVSDSARLWVSVRRTAENRQIHGPGMLDCSKRIWKDSFHSEPSVRLGQAEAMFAEEQLATVRQAPRAPSRSKGNGAQRSSHPCG